MKRINDKKTGISVDDCIKILVDNMSIFKAKTGVRLILTVMRNPGIKIPLQVIYSDTYVDSDDTLLNYNDFLLNTNDYTVNSAIDTPVLMADKQAVRQVVKRTDYLIKKIAEYNVLETTVGLTDTMLQKYEEAKQELDSCENYLAEVYNPIGKRIRYFPNSRTKRREAAQQACRRAIKEIKEHFPEVAETIEANLTIKGWYAGWGAVK